ncbi:MAG: hypothetical protein KJN93_00185 [Alphaproteobacteria bacterium]|nr:hypothetical protein [Alphaproteobacteria bacterium]NNF24224.1 hypothetical protein [Paracoccaceae bacterium]
MAFPTVIRALPVRALPRPALRQFIEETNGLFSDGSDLAALWGTPECTYLVIHDNTPRFFVFGLFANRAQVYRNIGKVLRELSLPPHLMKIWEPPNP